MRTTTWRRLSAALAFTAVATLAVGCGSSDSDGAKDTGSGGGDESSLEAIRVPQDHRTIQEAVDAAKSGDLILIDEGTYKEAVDVTTPDITLRGVDRNKVILDGGFKLENGVRILDTDGVVVENMTARNYLSNGFYWTGSDRYRGSYLTAYRNGDYGIYAFDAYHGQFDHSLGSGSPDAGFYIGECYKCDAVIDDVVSEHNGLGYSGTNSGGDLYIINSTFRYNRAGIVPNAGSYELCYPGRRNTIVGNTVYDNNNNDAPAIDVALLAQGNGILVAGSVDNVVERNLVFKHDRTGIAAVPFPEEDANDRAPDKSEWDTPATRPATRRSPPRTPIPASCSGTLRQLVRGQRGGGLRRGRPRQRHPRRRRHHRRGPGQLLQRQHLHLVGPRGHRDAGALRGHRQRRLVQGCARPGAADRRAGPQAPKDTYTKTPVPEDQESMPDALTKPAAKFEGPEKPDVDGIEVPKKPAA
ncbi:MAG: right-handed parallel beta-helix repeat-containing protein [Acidimicrobiales bacterium]